MTKVVLKSLLLCLLIISISTYSLCGQTNAHAIYKDIIGSDYHFSFISSAAAPKILDFPEYGSFTITQNSNNDEIYDYSYFPGISEGNTKAVIEYYKEDQQTGALIPDYTTIYFRITPSLINCADDRLSVDVNANAVQVDVLANDSRTDGPLVLTNILFAEHGTAKILDNTILFTPEKDFSGDAFVYYAVKDNIGKKGSGMLKVKVIDADELPKKLDLSYISHGGEEVEIDLPYEGFALKNNLEYGSFKYILGKAVYTPNSNSSSKESFLLTKDGLTRTVTVEVIYKHPTNSWVVDDEIITTKGSAITIDVLSNDLKRGEQITHHSSDLVTTGEQGVFSYDPPDYFQGTKKFNYTVSDGYNTETGYVSVLVNDFHPQTRYNYDFTSISNAPLIINYNIPISNFTFELVAQPSSGSVAINEGLSTITYGCDEVTGNNLVIYEPDYGFKGNDQFTLKYCVNNSCKNFEVTVTVEDASGANCPCFTDCVWSGDANADGVVNASDLLTMANAFGQTGKDTDLNAEHPWSGRKVSDWKYESPKGINAKFSDANGNGVVDEADFTAISENYNRIHDFVPPQFFERRPFPFILELVDDTVYAGDLIEFNIGIGNQIFPALDVSGLSYTMGFPGSVVDSSSLQIAYHSDSWFGIDEKVVSVSEQVRKGWVESAVSRIGPKPKSGVGTIGTASFIVEEDVVGGFRVDKKGIIPITFDFKDIKVMDSAGQLATLADAELTIYINLKARADQNEEALLKVYPNPASNVLNLHMNGGHDLISYEIFNVNGQKLASQQLENARHHKIDTQSFSQGVYILRVETSHGMRLERFEIIR